MKRIIWLPLAGFLLIAGATVAAAAPTITPVATSAVNTITGADTDVSQAPFGRGDLLEQVLADLVEAGTITQGQSDAIIAALTDEVQTRRTAAQEHRELMLGFIADGVITQDEIDQLPADSRLSELWNSIAEDGQVNVEDLRGLGPGIGRGRGHGPGMGPGQGPWFDADDDATTD